MITSNRGLVRTRRPLEVERSRKIQDILLLYASTLAALLEFLPPEASFEVEDLSVEFRRGTKRAFIEILFRPTPRVIVTTVLDNLFIPLCVTPHQIWLLQKSEDMAQAVMGVRDWLA